MKEEDKKAMKRWFFGFGVFFFKWESSVNRQWMDVHCQDLLKENARAHLISLSWVCDCPSDIKLIIINSDIWNSPHLFELKWLREVSYVSRIKEAGKWWWTGLCSTSSAVCPQSAWLATPFPLGTEHLWWLCFLADPQALDLHLLGPSFV